MPRWVAAKEYVPSLHLPLEPVGREDEVVAGLGDELPKLVSVLPRFCPGSRENSIVLKGFIAL